MQERIGDDCTARPKLLQVSAACSPLHGSEPGVGWHWALEAAKRFDTWVITTDNEHAEETRQYLAAHGDVPGLRFVFVPAGAVSKFLDRFRGPSYWGYALWQRRALQVARKLHAQVRFDLGHQVTFCTFREPGCVVKLGIPFVWGPVGGTQNYPWRFLGEAGFLGAISEAVRSTLNLLQLRFSRRLRRSARLAGVLLAANSENRQDITRAMGVSPTLLLETGVESTALEPRRRRTEQGRFRILWCGVLIPRKALSLLLKALAQLPEELPYELRIIGRGAQKRRWQRLSRRLGIDPCVTWIESLPHGQMCQQYAWADLFVFSSLRDTTGNVILEALSTGLPVIGLDHQGVHDVLDESCGIRVPVTTPREVIGRLAEAILRLARDAALWDRLSAGALQRAKSLLWGRQGDRMAEIYRQLIGRCTQSPEPPGPAGVSFPTGVPGDRGPLDDNS